jgi:hypothetical protein
MTMDYNEVAIGFDLGRESSVFTFYHQNNTEPMTVSSVPGEEKYQIPTPRDLFPLIEQEAELGVALLSNFFKMCFEKLSAVGPMGGISVMVTMEIMKPVWVKAIRQALEMLDVPMDRIYLQDYLESFYYYALSQKKDLWRYKVALFEYKQDFITGYELSINANTKPAMVTIKNRGRICLDEKTRGSRKPEHWKRMKDVRFLEQAKKQIGTDAYSTVYLVGEEFDQSWEHESIKYLCSRRKVYQGQNLYSKGACYGAMHLSGMVSIGSFLYAGPDMIEHNISMKMFRRGVESRVDMINAGINYYMAYYTCEFILDDTEELVFTSRSIHGDTADHTVKLTDLPKRPNRATRIRMEMTFAAKDRCRVRLEDLGLGELYKSSGKKWEAVIGLEKEA